MLALKLVYSGIVTRKPSKATTSAKNRARPALRSDPVKSTTMAPTMGTQMERLSRIEEFEAIISVDSWRTRAA